MEASTTRGERDAVWDDYVLGGLLVGVGGLRVAIAVAEHERFAAEATLAVIAVLVGVIVILSALLRR